MCSRRNNRNKQGIGIYALFILFNECYQNIPGNKNMGCCWDYSGDTMCYVAAKDCPEGKIIKLSFLNVRMLCRGKLWKI